MTFQADSLERTALVVGDGIAGTVAAIALRKAGWTPIVEISLGEGRIVAQMSAGGGPDGITKTIRRADLCTGLRCGRRFATRSPAS